MSHTSSPALPEHWRALVKASRDVRSHAYAPFSRYQVGAAVLTDDDQIYVGCNVENSSYGLTICAERVAIGSAVATGRTRFKAIAISLTGIAVPCGSCRQVLYEFNPEMAVLLDDLNGEDQAPECLALSSLLPRGFRLDG